MKIINFKLTMYLRSNSPIKISVLLGLLLFSLHFTNAQTQTFNTSGNFTVPAGVTSVKIEAWGSGAAGNKNIYRGGGGGAFAGNNSLSVTPGTQYTVTVGLGAAAGSGADGQNSSFGTTLVVAAGGAVGTGGQASNSTGTILFSGGNGGRSYSGGGAGGGGGGGTGQAGGVGGDTNTNSGGLGGLGGTTLGGNGGKGGDHNQNGSTGVTPGGGGGEAGINTSNISGGGGNGRVIVTWTCPTYSLSSTSSTSPLCAGNSATVTLTSSAAGLPVGTYTVTYNQSAPNSATGLTKTMTVITDGTGSFTTNILENSGATTITITNLSSGSGTPNCSSIISANNTAIVTVTPNMTVTASTPQTLCINNVLTNITHTTTGATGISNDGVSGANGLPVGVTANWAGGTITISGTPTASGTFNYSIPLTGSCGSVNATGTITITEAWSAYAGPNVTNCIGATLTGGTTGVLPSTPSTILSENFNIGGLPSGWVRTNNGTTGYTDFPNTSELASIGNTWCGGNSATGNGCIGRAMYFYTYWVPNNTSGYLETPAMDLSLYTSASLTFYIYNSGGTDNLKVYAKQGSGTYSQIGLSYSIYSSWTQIAISLNSLVGGSNNAVKIKFEGTSDFGTSNIGIDDVLITGSLPPPTYSWSGPGGFTSSSQNPYVTTSGTYTLTVAAGTCTSTSQVIATINPINTVTTTSSIPTMCINTALTNITHTTTGATGIGAATGLPAGVTAAWAANVITISGTPTVAGTFNYSIPLTGGCGSVNATGTITVTINNTVETASSTPNLCVNTVLTNITHATTGATGIGAATGLPAGVTAALAANIITISGTPTVAGTFNYSIPLTGGCGSVNATGTITVTPAMTIGVASTTPTLCINTDLTNITHATTGATGIGATTNLPAGVTAAWAANVITISGTPTAAGTFNYSIPLTGGCGSLNATGTITVTANATAGTVTAGTTPQCIGQTTTYTVSGQVLSGGIGIWSSSNDAVATVNSSTGLVTAVGPGTCTIIYTVTGGCNGTPSASQPYTVNPPVPATPGTITVTAAQCPSLTSQIYSISDVTDATTYNWTVPTGWSITTGLGTTSITVSIGSADQNGNISVSAQNSCGTSSEQTMAVTGNTINYWTGSANTTEWNNTVNWSSGIPSDLNKLDILIPIGLSKYPQLSDELTIKNIEIQNGALLNVLNNGLTITGVLILNGILDLQGESQLIQETTSSLIICNNSSGSIEIDQQGTSDHFKYNYWASPVNTTGANYTIAGVLRDGSFPSSVKTINFGSAYTYADTKVTPTLEGSSIKLSTYWMYKYTNNVAGNYSAWTAVGKDGLLKVGEGFTMKGSNSTFAEQNYTFIGKPNNGDINLTIDAGKQYLIGNPYPSALEVDQFILDNIKQYTKIDGTIVGGNRTENIIDGNLYFWDHFGGGTHFLKSYEGGYSLYNLSGGVAAIANDTKIKATLNSSTKSAQKFIPVAQGFFVTGLEGGEIQFKNSQRKFKKENASVSQFLRNTVAANATKVEANVKDNYPRIYLKYSSPSGLRRQLLVAFIPNSTDSLDIGYDAINGERFSEDMSWKVGNTKLVIQAVPTLDNERILPLEVKVGTTGLATISIDFLENINANTEIFLKDNLSGVKYDMKSGPFEINLEPGIYTNRFELVFQILKPLASEEDSFIEDIINIYINNPENTIFINHNESVYIKEISIYNMLGQQIQSIKKEFNRNAIKIPFSAQSGVYIVNVKTDKETISKKIIKL